jgi:hypothetical protein
VEHESSVGDWQFLHAAGEHLHDSPDPLLPLAFLLLKFEDAMPLQQHKLLRFMVCYLRLGGSSQVARSVPTARVGWSARIDGAG